MFAECQLNLGQPSPADGNFIPVFHVDNIPFQPDNMFDIHDEAPVSYTHLDLYKRQTLT